MTGSKVVMLSSFVGFFVLFLKPLAVKMALTLDRHMYWRKF